MREFPLRDIAAAAAAVFENNTIGQMTVGAPRDARRPVRAGLAARGLARPVRHAGAIGAVMVARGCIAASVSGGNIDVPRPPRWWIPAPPADPSPQEHH